jgi:DNA-binding PadR family transcriptional regulator
MSALPTGLHELGMGLPPADRKAIEQRLQRLRRDGLVEVLWRHPSRGQAPNVYDLTPYGRERLEYAQAVYAQETAA